MSREEFVAELERLGERSVRLKLAAKEFKGKRKSLARAWLDQVEVNRRESHHDATIPSVRWNTVGVWALFLVTVVYYAYSVARGR
jgi:hypothetical protein